MLDFVITNDKAFYVAKEDSIHLFSVAKETTLNKQQIKPCVPFERMFSLEIFNTDVDTTISWRLITVGTFDHY